MADFVFVSGNLKKVEYLERFLGQKVEHHELDLTEIQSLDPIEVVEHKVREAYSKLQRPVLVEDTALKFTAFGKLPGAFIKYFLSEIGTSGMCKMLDDFEDRSAVASVIYGLYDGKSMHIFDAQQEGMVPPDPKDGRGMGWNPIFIPNGQEKTYGQMSEQEYDHHSVRNMAVKKLKDFLK